MKSNVFNIMKKECSRIFSDRKLFFTAVLLPGIIIFLLWNLMGNFMDGMMEADDNHIYQVHAVNMPDSIASMLSPNERINIINTSEAQIAGVRDDIRDRNTDLLLVFPSNFDEIVANFDPQTSAEPAANVEIWSNSANNESREVQMLVSSLIHAYHHSLTHRFTVNTPPAGETHMYFDLATDADIFGMVMGFLIPMMFILFIFQSCQALAPESISGEKERGTLAGMLVTPARRTDMALGKILGIAAFALLGGIGAMIGMVFSIPSMMAGIEFDGILGFLSVSDLALMLLVALSTTLVFVGALSVMSAYAKTVKEATAYSMPLMIIAMVGALGSTILGYVPTEIYFYLIPVFNSALSISAVFANEVSVVNMAVTAATNVVFTLICVGALAKIFNSEKIVFS